MTLDTKLLGGGVSTDIGTQGRELRPLCQEQLKPYLAGSFLYRPTFLYRKMPDDRKIAVQQVQSAANTFVLRRIRGTISAKGTEIMRLYIHQQDEWPAFRWNAAALTDQLADVSRQQGRLIGRMQSLGIRLRAEAVLTTLTEEVVKSSDIEGEVLDRDQVRSSLARRLGMDAGGLPMPDRRVEGMVEMMLDATRNYASPLTADRLFGWHAALFPTGHSGISRIVVGAWRNEASGPMQIVSGPYGREKVHYEAPGFDRLPSEMALFLDWFESDQAIDPVLKAAIAHLWFVTIHPFDDGNGRIARAIADLALARSEESPQRFYSISAQIRQERKAYYDVLEATQRGDLDLTPWLQWFLACLGRAFAGAERTLESVIYKSRFWEHAAGQSLNDRQRAMLNRMLDGFEGRMTSSKWAKIMKTSQDTATRDINDLVNRGLLVKDSASGRSTSYSLATVSEAET